MFRWQEIRLKKWAMEITHKPEYDAEEHMREAAKVLAWLKGSVVTEITFTDLKK